MNRGSEWRIWDLHVHTPFSLEHNYKCNSEENIWDKYIDALEHLPSDIKVLGINDYLFIDGYRKVLEYKAQGRLQNIELILPVVEFRLAKFCGNEKFKRINFHIIFSNELTPDLIQQQFLNALTAHYTLSSDCNQQWGGIVTRDSLEELGRKIINSVPEEKQNQYASPLKEGFNNLNLELSVIMSPLNNASHIFDGKYITAIGKTEWDDFKWDDNSIAEKKSIINEADIVFTAAEDIDKYKKSKKKLHEQQVNELLLDCSDAHCFSDETTIKDRLGNCKTWIKADTTFEGLKQILFEPDDRVRVQSTKPDEKNIYQVIDSITLNEDGFWRGTIPLNPNLNTIVGGRSTGKSSLLKAIAAKHGNKGVDNDDFIRQHLNGVSIRWQDGNDQLGREIEYFRQSYMHDIAFDSNKTNQIIEDIIKHKDETGLLKEYYEHLTELSKAISESVFSVFQMQKEIDLLKKSLSEKGKREGVNQQLNLLKAKVADLQKDAELTSEERLSLDVYINQVQEKKKLISNAEQDLTIFEKLLSSTPFDSSYEEKWQFGNISFGLNQSETYRLFSNLKVKTETEWNKIVNELKDNTVKAKLQLTSEIQTITNSDIYKKGIRIFEGNKELKDLNIKIQEEEKTLTAIDEMQNRLDKTIQQQNNLILRIIDNHHSFKTSAEHVSESLSISYDGLDIHVSINFHKEEFRDFLENRLNQRGYERQEYLQGLLNNYDNNNKINSSFFLKNLLTGDVLLKNGYDAQNVAVEFLSRNWYSLNYSITYQSDTFANMSEGKQAFVILKLLLDFSDKKCPILIDQPEDSLDNRAIYNELVAYIKRKKQERQIILVTHNSNVVVSADAENVIVANQNGTDTPNWGGLKFQYIHGALKIQKVRTKQRQRFCLHRGLENISVIFWKVDVRLLKNVNKNMDLEGNFNNARTNI